MAINAEKLNLAAQLMAIEYLIIHLYKVVYRILGVSGEHIEESHRSIREMLQKETFSGVDAAESDLIVGEISDHIDRLLNAIEELSAKGRLKGQT